MDENNTLSKVEIFQFGMAVMEAMMRIIPIISHASSASEREHFHTVFSVLAGGAEAKHVESGDPCTEAFGRVMRIFEGLVGVHAELGVVGEPESKTVH